MEQIAIYKIHFNWLNTILYCITDLSLSLSLSVAGRFAVSVRVYLLDGALGLEEDASAQQLGEDAAHRPDVDGVGVMAASHEDLGGAVVLRHHFLRHVTRLIRLLHPSKTEVTDLW